MRAALLVLLCLSACATLTPADQAELSGDATLIAKCQTEGRACKADGGGSTCYGFYESCMKDGGL